MGVPDELEEVVGDEFDLCEDLLPLGPEVPGVPDVFDNPLVCERAHRIRAVAILDEALDIDGVPAEEVVARHDAHRDWVRPAGETHLEAVKHDVHVDLAAAPVAPNLAEHHVPERRPVDGLLTQDLLKRLVDIDRVDARVTVCRDTEEGIRLGLVVRRLVATPGWLDERVEALRFDSLIGVGVLVGDSRLDGLWKVTDRLGEGLRFVNRLECTLRFWRLFSDVPYPMGDQGGEHRCRVGLIFAPTGNHDLVDDPPALE